jgi:predicted pyridoxine 5'-phosphate oxidase superfamily flavin-nucleotide-binding protein
MSNDSLRPEKYESNSVQMKLSLEIQNSIQESVLCWMASISNDGYPSVTPKEAFTYDEKGVILIANIASPQSVANIQNHHKVCLSFINVLTQKGFKIKGTAKLIEKIHAAFESYHDKLGELVGTRFKILSIIEVTPEQSEPIVAPSYRLFKETTEESIIKESFKSYQIESYAEKIKKLES